MGGCGFKRMLQVWVMFLVQICLMGRASDVTIDFCPLLEDTQLPADHLWDLDGLPKWIELGMRDWKWRSAANKGKRYGIKIHRNYLDARFCPVTWLMLYLKIFAIEKGPIFQDKDGVGIKEPSWLDSTDRLFKAAGLYIPGQGGCTNHSIRKAACQWAGRCLANPLDVKNCGRWQSYDEMADYYAQGQARRARLTEGNGVDPIWRMWVWKPCCAPNADGRSQL